LTAQRNPPYSLYKNYTRFEVFGAFKIKALTMICCVIIFD